MNKIAIIVVLGMVGCSSTRDETRPVAYGAPAGTETVSGISGDALVSGLTNINVSDALANVHDSSSVVDITDSMRADELQMLSNSVRDNETANTNAYQLTRELQKRGIIGPEERIIGASGGKLYKTSVML